MWSARAVCANPRRCGVVAAARPAKLHCRRSPARAAISLGFAQAAPVTAAVQPAANDKTETVNVEESKQPVTVASRPQKIDAKVTEAGLGAEMISMQRELAKDPGNTGSGEARAATMRGGLWSRPDHSPDSTLHSPGQ